MADIALTIDPDDTSLALHDRANGYRVLGFDAPVPETDSQWAFSADTEGERRANLRYKNRVITAQVLVEKTTDAALEAAENTLGQKVAKLAREGGELRFAYPTGTTITFDVLEATFTRLFDIGDVARKRARYAVAFICKPFGLGAEEDLGDNTETTLPYLVFTEAAIKGDVPALGRLVIDDDSGSDQWWLAWGMQSRHYSNSANAALFYQAESRTALGGAAIAAVASASGGTVVRQGTLLSSYQAMLSTQASGGGTHLSHVGEFRAYARAMAGTANAGTVTVAFEWGEGDFSRSTINTPTEIDPAQEGQWRLVDLGLISLSEVVSGTQRWEGRVLAKSTSVGDDLDVDYLMFVPTAEGSGIVSGVIRAPTPTSFVGRDEFTGTTAGNALNGRTATTGGTWATSGAATDFSFADAGGGVMGTFDECITRTASGVRYAILGSTDYTNVRVKASNGPNPAGLIARWTDANNHLRGQITESAVLEISTVVSGTTTVLASKTLTGTTVALEMIAYANGFVTLTAYSLAGVELGSVSATSSVLAIGGTLATGEPGIFDPGTGFGAQVWDDFLVSVPPADAAIFASQSLEVRHDRVVREDSGGTLWTTPSSYQGDYLLVPPAGAEGRTTRMIVKVTRSDPFALDSSIDDISARLFVTPRYLVVPDA